MKRLLVVVIAARLLLAESRDQPPRAGRRMAPRIRIDYRIRGRRGRWEEQCGRELEYGSVEYAANLLMAIVDAHLMDLTAPPPDHVAAAV